MDTKPDFTAPVSFLQEAVAQRLRDALAVETVCSRSGDLAARVAEALSRSRSSALLVHVPYARLRYPNLPRPHLDPVSVEVTVFRNTAIDSAGPSAADIAIRAASALIGWTPPCSCRPLAPSDGEIKCDFDDGYERATITLSTAVSIPTTNH